MNDFRYHCPASLGEALQLLETAAAGKLLAGGQTLIPLLKQRLAAASDLIDLARVTELRGVREEEPHRLVIGAMTSHAEAAHSCLLRTVFPALSSLAGSIGDPQVRNRGTLGGTIAHPGPAAEYPAALLAVGARIHTDRRQIASEDFFTGLFQTSLEATEIITAVSFPVPSLAAYAKFRDPISRYPLVGVFVARDNTGIRVTVCGAGATVFRAVEWERALAEDFVPQALEGIRIPPASLLSDLHASAEYRAHLMTVMAKRAVQAAILQPGKPGL